MNDDSGFGPDSMIDDMERALVGCLLFRPGVYAEIAGMVRDCDFGLPEAKAVFSAIHYLSAVGEAVDHLLVAKELERRGRLEEVGGVDALKDCMRLASSEMNVRDYARKIADAARLRRQADAVAMAHEAIESGGNPDAVCRSLRTSLDEALEGSRKVEFLNTGQWLREAIANSEPVLDGLFDVGDKAFIIGPSKTRKSFFAMQLAVALATGDKFLDFYIPRRRRVVVCQFEIQPQHYHRRLSRLASATGADYDALDGRLWVANLRGTSASIEDITASLRTFEPEVIILDPLYKSYGQGHDENSAGDAASLMAQFDIMARKLGCAIVIIHHDSKYTGRETKGTARGSGSGLLARDYDACILLSPHATEQDGIVVDTVIRNYPPREAFSILWADGRFTVSEDILPLAETAATRRLKEQRGVPDDEIIAKIEEWFDSGSIHTKALKNRIRDTFHVGINRADTIVQEMVESHGYVRTRNPETGLYEIVRQVAAAASW